MICKICETQTDYAFSGILLCTREVKYFRCRRCEFLFTENPIWLDDARAKSVSRFDTGMLSRNLLIAKIVTVLIKILFDPRARFLDYGGGYGVFTRLMRDNGFDFYWHDPFSENLFAKGFEFISASHSKFELVTAIEVFEHLPSPKGFTDFCFGNSLTDSLFLTTLLYGSSPPNHDDWWYYSKETGQHISFYNQHTLKYIANSFQANLYSHSDFFHLITRKKISSRLYKIILKHAGRIYRNISMRSKVQEDYQFLISKKGNDIRNV